jgi:REP element-mobilizing transposase RayT
MPDYVHLVLWWDVVSKPKLTIGKIMQGIKSHAAKEIAAYFKTGRRKPSLSPYSAASEGSRLPKDYRWKDLGLVHTPSVNNIWQPLFYDFNIRTERKLRQKLAYIYENPVRAGLCKKPEDWPWSSYRQVELGKPSGDVQVTIL